MTRLILVRHGESEKNLLGINSSDKEKYPLTNKGKQQAEEYKNMLQNEPLDVAYSSPVLRAKETARIILANRDIGFGVDDRLSEEYTGEWEGKTERDLLDDSYRQEYIQMFRNNDSSFFVAKKGKIGESFDDIKNRTESFIREVVKKHQDKTILIVAHGANLLNVLRIFRDCSVEDVFGYLRNEVAVGSKPLELYVNTNFEEFVNC